MARKSKSVEAKLQEGNGLHDHDHPKEFVSGLQEKLYDLLGKFGSEDFMDGYEQFKSLLPVGEEIWKFCRKDVAQVVGLLVGVVLDISEDLKPTTARWRKMDAESRALYLSTLISAGFERHEAMQIILAQIKPTNFSTAINQAVHGATTKLNKKQAPN